MRAHTETVLLLLLLAGSAPVPGAVRAQEITASAGVGHSGFESLGHPSVVSLEVALPLVSSLRLTGRWRRVDGGRRFDGTTCDAYWPIFEACREEAIETDADLDQWQVGLRVGLPATGRVRLHLGVARVRSRLRGSSRGVETGRSAGDYLPGEAVWHTALSLGVRTEPLASGLLQAGLRLQSQPLDLRGCATDVGTPFCGSERLTTLEATLTLVR
ncbi:MAG: hypothetical protein PVI57_20805 [Gemmatimonadota bacterium]|jgi:hypothetical protein